LAQLLDKVSTDSFYPLLVGKVPDTPGVPDIMPTKEATLEAKDYFLNDL